MKRAPKRPLRRNKPGAVGDAVRDAGLKGSGISPVDPEPLSTMGEAIDPDAVEAAHEGAPLPRKNVP